MGTAFLKASLDKAIADLERKKVEIDAALDKFRSARSAIDEMSRILRDDLSLEAEQEEEIPEKEPEERGDEEAITATPNPSGTSFERIKAFLALENSPQTVAQIEQGAGVPRTSISAVLYRTHKGHFVPITIPGDSRAKGWVLKESSIGQRALGLDNDIPF